MLYQPLITNSVPYVARRSEIKKFLANIHHETEIIYCHRGRAVIRAGEKEYVLKDGTALFIGSLVPHEGIESYEYNEGLVIEVGPMFLGDRFKSFQTPAAESKLYTRKNAEELCDILDEVYNMCGEKTGVSELMTLGNIYRICGHILGDIEKRRGSDTEIQLPRSAEIEKALELVYHYYSEPITVQQAAELCGYGKSNFCKVFKEITGIGFHTFLNSYRVKNAGYLLSNSDKTLDEISVMVGLREAKTLCRVFKEFTGITPGEYRKQHCK